jgi:hypothetical protein
MAERIVETEREVPRDTTVVHEHDADRGNNTGLIIAVVIILVIVLLLIFGRGLIGGSSGSGGSAPSIPSTGSSSGQ